jgi:hypothetical protein
MKNRTADNDNWRVSQIPTPSMRGVVDSGFCDNYEKLPGKKANGTGNQEKPTISTERFALDSVAVASFHKGG